jgi:hypothetical protein
VLVNSWTIGTKVNSNDDEKLNVRLRRTPPVNSIHIQPRKDDEPLFKTFRCGTLTVRGSTRANASTGELVITAKRVLVLLHHGSTGKGANKYTIVSIDRAEISTPITKIDRHGRVTRLELPVPGGSVSAGTQSTNLTSFLKALGEPPANLGPEAAAARREAGEREAQEKAEADRKTQEEQVQAATARFNAQAAAHLGASPVSLSAGGILDHRKTWQYRVAASDEDCLRAFAAAFSGGGGVLLRAKWEVRKQPNGAVAIYRGRKGFIGAVTVMSETASAEQQGAIGSEVKFEIVGPDGNHTICAMWLASHASRLGFTNDARFFRPYMRAVEDQLRRLDSSIQVIKE